MILKALFLRGNIKEVFFGYMNNLDTCNYYCIKPSNIVFKIINKLHLNTLIFSKWKKEVKKYDVFILGENYYSSKISKYIKNKNKSARIIMYFLNVLNPTYEKILDDTNIDEFWTFDKNDAKKYNMKYNPQFYSDEIKLVNKDAEYDVLYIGRDKGRKKELLDIKDICENNNIKTNFYIIEIEKDFISYDQCLELISRSKCIVDYNQSNQIGLSLRPLEALFFEKKLITNNHDIVNYNFYNSNNIFIIGKDDNKKLGEFIKNPYKKIDKKIIDYYDYKEWLKRFDVK